MSRTLVLSPLPDISYVHEQYIFGCDGLWHEVSSLCIGKGVTVVQLLIGARQSLDSEGFVIR
jgi:hypothetical protein